MDCGCFWLVKSANADRPLYSFCIEFLLGSKYDGLVPVALRGLLELRVMRQLTGLSRWLGGYLAENCRYKYPTKTRIFKGKGLNDYVEDGYERRGFLEGNT
jgi:hypothetical protein